MHRKYSGYQRGLSPRSCRIFCTPARKPTGDASPPATPPAREFTIDELARIAGTTIRNVRPYQDRGLINPPERRGRIGIYTQTHLGWLKLINHLLRRSYTLSNIQKLPEAIAEGHDLRSILGLESTIASPWSDESPKYYSFLALAKLFGRAMSRQALAWVISLSLLEPDGLGYLARSPKALLAGAQMAKADFPLVEVLDIIEHARPHTQAVADDLVSMVVRELGKYGSDPPPVEDVPRLADVIWRIRPLALVAVEAELMCALETAANKHLGDRMAWVIEHIHKSSGSTPGPDKGQCLQHAHVQGVPDLLLV